VAGRRLPATLKQNEVNMKQYLMLGLLLIAILQVFAVNNHFSPVWTGNGYDQMNIYVSSATLNNIPLTIGDEIAVFDGSNCVGVTRITSHYNTTVPIIVSRDDNPENEIVNGFTDGNPIRFAIWNSASNTEVFQGRNLSAVFDSGPSVFTANGSASVHLFTPENLHYQTVWSGNGVDHMNFYVNGISIIGAPLEAGDEIAIFDGANCVGAEKIYSSYCSIIPVVVSKNDAVGPDNPVNGYIVGNNAVVKIWKANSNTEYIQNASDPGLNLNVNYTQGSSVFSVSGSSVMEITTSNSSYFHKIWTGNGNDHMNFYVSSALIYGAPLKVGDEVAVFDGNRCVGFTKVMYYEQIRDLISIAVSKNDVDPSDPNGYIPGNTASIRIWDSSSNTEIIEGDGLAVQYISGTSTFVENASASMNLNAIIKLDDPIFNYESGTYTEGISLTITSNMPGAVVRATNDGTEPNENTPIHIPPGFLTGNQDWVIKAKVYKDNYQASDTVTRNYHITGTLSAPIFSPDPAIPNNSPVNVTISCALPASIHYTLDGTVPTEASTLYQGPILISSTKTIKAKAFATDWIPSTVSEATYVVLNAVTNLSATAVAANINLSWEAVLPTPESDLRTLNGYRIYRRTGTTGDFVLLNQNLVSATTYTDSNLLPNTYYYYVIAVYAEGNSNPSNTANAQVIKVADPVFNPPAGTYTTAQNVSITCATAGSQIRYTIDGTDPTNTSPLYSAPINVPLNTNRTIKAKAFKVDCIASNIVSEVYNVTGTVAAPVFAPNAGTYQDSVRVTMSCATPNAQIRYTLNGTEPTSTSPLYSQSILITVTTTVKAKAFKTDWAPSGTTSGAYVIQVASDTPELLAINKLNMPYPNPFNPSTTISFNLKQSGQVSLDVYNIKGQRVCNLLSGRMESGEHSVIWNGTNDDKVVLPGGVYFVRMKTNDFTQLRKIILIK